MSSRNQEKSKIVWKAADMKEEKKITEKWILPSEQTPEGRCFPGLITPAAEVNGIGNPSPPQVLKDSLVEHPLVLKVVRMKRPVLPPGSIWIKFADNSCTRSQVARGK